MATSFDSSYATASESAAGKAAGAFRSHARRTVLAGAVTNLIAALVFVFVAEAIARGSLSDALAFFAATDTPAITTVATVAFAFAALEALFGRRLLPILALGPVLLLLPIVHHEKSFYLSDPLFPSDFLFARQMVEIMPLIVRERPMAAIGAATLLVAVIAFLVAAFVFLRRRFPKLSVLGRATRLAVALPPLVFIGSLADYSTFSAIRDRLQIVPIMWDQKENYAHNGFLFAFLFNVPMAHVTAPKGYSEQAIAGIDPSRLQAASSGSGAVPASSSTLPAVPAVAGRGKPDVIMVMSESFWDPTRMPGVTFNTDPMPTIRAAQSGWSFSPEFGGMTANVEFEALTGFSNAFLPYGSIPYQQYVRHKTPSLATFFRSEGYATRAIHPFQAWFWNRGNVYAEFGFDDFKSEENLPPLEKRGPLASDAALTEEIIREADSQDRPFFFFAVTLQGHGPYEAGRYPDPVVKAASATLDPAALDALATYSEGVHDADRAMARLMDWASRRERETILVFFGDHLPPLGPAFVRSGYMKDFVATRRAAPEVMAREHETPLIVWSNRRGTAETGTISPSFLPFHILTEAGMSHPYYTGFLGAVHDRYRVVERNVLVGADGVGQTGWADDNDKAKAPVDPLITDFRLLQYDVMFGKRAGLARFFPEMAEPADDGAGGLISALDPGGVAASAGAPQRPASGS